MSTSLLHRIARLFKAQAHDALDSIEDPGKVVRQMVRDLGSEITKHEEAIAFVIGDYKLLSKKMDEATKDASEWNAKAEKAVLAGRDDLATLALEHAARAESNSEEFAKALSILSPKVEMLKSNLADLRKKKNKADNEAELLNARTKAANATSQAARILGGIGYTSVNFDSMRERVDKMEAKAETLGEMANDKNGVDIDTELATLSVTPITDRLAALKAKVNT